MPLNPFTGEFEGYDSPSTQAGVGMAAMSVTGLESTLAFRMLEDSPGPFAAPVFSINRGANTLMKGGSSPRFLNFDANKGVFNRSKDFFGTRSGGAIGRRATRLNSLRGDSAKAPFLRPALRNNMPRFKNFTQFTDLSVFADPRHKRYSPFGASGFLGNREIGSKLANKIGVDVADGETAFGPGLLSAITAGRRTDLLEKKALGGNGRALKKLGVIDNNISTMMSMNNRGMLTPQMNMVDSGLTRKQAFGMTRFERGGLGVDEFFEKNRFKPVAGRSFADDAMLRTVNVLEGPMVGGGQLIGGSAGVRGNMMASTMAGAGTRYIAGYARGSLGFGGVAGLSDRALEGARAAEANFAKAFNAKTFGDEGLRLASGKVLKTGDEAIDFLRSTGGGKFFGELGAKGIGKIATSGGGKMLAMRAGAMAIPGLNLIAAASFAYDIGKMAGEVVKSGIELARDAGKSLQGTIAKPMFGMGYKDTEAAATSRSRGVMAIQNSRLNMRSLLGSEAAMMAAHYG